MALIKYKANINILSVENETPLYVAVKSRNPEIVTTLLEAGANPKIGKSLDNLAEMWDDNQMPESLKKSDTPNKN